jgi:hypothetical protein
VRFKRRSAKLVALAAAGALALVPAGTAGAKIAPANCTNGGGNQPGGQQPTCQGGGLTQNPAENPAGQAPPGQQP